MVRRNPNHPMFGPGRPRELSRRSAPGANGGESQRIHNEISARHDAYLNSPEGRAALIAQHEQEKIRTQERIDGTQDWIQTHIADSALKLAMAYGREEPTDEDIAAASTVIGATFNAIQEPEYQNMPKPGWRFK
jgi:hypothetical protein